MPDPVAHFPLLGRQGFGAVGTLCVGIRPWVRGAPGLLVDIVSRGIRVRFVDRAGRTIGPRAARVRVSGVVAFRIFLPAYTVPFGKRRGEFGRIRCTRWGDLVETFVDRVGDQIVLQAGERQQSVQIRLDLDLSHFAPEGEIAEPQFLHTQSGGTERSEESVTVFAVGEICIATSNRFVVGRRDYLRCHLPYGDAPLCRQFE